MRKRMATIRIAAALAVFAALVALASRHQANLNVVDREADAAETQEILRLNDVQAASVPVQPLMAIEDTWDIEDTHEPADVPLVTMHVTDYDGLGDEYMPARFTMSSWDYPAVDLPAKTHLRSGGYSPAGGRREWQTRPR